MLAGLVNEAGGGIDGAGGAYDEHERSLIDLALDAIHAEWDFSEEDDVRAEKSAAGAATNVGEDAVDGMVFYGWAAATVFAAGLGEFSVHMEEANGAGALVQVVNVLRAEEEAVAELSFELGESDVTGVGLGGLRGRSACGIELPYEGGIALPGFGSADVIKVMAGPEAVRGAEGGGTRGVRSADLRLGCRGAGRLVRRVCRSGR